MFSDHSIVLNTLAVYSKSGRNRSLFTLQICLSKNNFKQICFLNFRGGTWMAGFMELEPMEAYTKGSCTYAR